MNVYSRHWKAPHLREQAGAMADQERIDMSQDTDPANVSLLAAYGIWKCGCWTCVDEVVSARPFPDNLSFPFIVCATCGNKRCPRAEHHDNDCTHSNAPGQPGSPRYAIHTEEERAALRAAFLDTTEGGLTVAIAGCGCDAGTPENGWHETRSEACLADERKQWARLFEGKSVAGFLHRSSLNTRPFND